MHVICFHPTYFCINVACFLENVGAFGVFFGQKLGILPLVGECLSFLLSEVVFSAASIPISEGGYVPAKKPSVS